MAIRHRPKIQRAQTEPNVRKVFEELVVPGGFQAELVDGEIILSPSGKRLHWLLIWALIQRFAQHSQWQCVAEQTVEHPGFQDLPEPDFFLVPKTADDPAHDAEYYPADQILFAAEVVSRSNADKDKVRKESLYAKFGIPLYLVIDPFEGQCVLHREPRGSLYDDKRTLPFGEPIELPAPLNITLSTDDFRTYPKRDARRDEASDGGRPRAGTPEAPSPPEAPQEDEEAQTD
ncbi:Uma2 family endonuclease [Actinocorallia sp. A-T 12471]|uniref:Uma2 family endonuclease n=1 Tax=Actinocorallia sp. A-T 12471 TaxID=3089813 RepID=UPI0029CF5369|nr:Uma2 family endonuclease [Actinocorallia sp. A-T 12471]MDX6740299.1 Uma2 family endonuclease [Actinocorallia sp. A-T 12471]